MTNNRAAIHAALATSDRIAIMDYLSSVPDAPGVAISKALGRSDNWISSCLIKLHKAGLIDRKSDSKLNAFDMDIRNSIAAGIVWPMRFTVAEHVILSNPDRVAVMDYLAEQDEASCSHIAVRIRCSQPTTTQHLIKLRRAGLVTTRRDKQTIYNRLADGVVWP